MFSILRPYIFSLDPEVAHDLAINSLNLNKDEILMIGDDIISDIKGSKDNLIKAIQVKTGKYQKHDENSNFIQPDIRIKSINDLPNVINN